METALGIAVFGQRGQGLRTVPGIVSLLVFTNASLDAAEVVYEEVRRIASDLDFYRGAVLVDSSVRVSEKVPV